MRFPRRTFLVVWSLSWETQGKPGNPDGTIKPEHGEPPLVGAGLPVWSFWCPHPLVVPILHDFAYPTRRSRISRGHLDIQFDGRHIERTDLS